VASITIEADIERLAPVSRSTASTPAILSPCTAHDVTRHRRSSVSSPEATAGASMVSITRAATTGSRQGVPTLPMPGLSRRSRRFRKRLVIAIPGANAASKRGKALR
jgi:hypothetical protein